MAASLDEPVGVDEVEFIERVLCRISLPDGDVFPALAGVRDARREGVNHRVHAAIWDLAGVFVLAVRRGLDNPPTGVSLWVLLRNQRGLQEDKELLKLLDYLTGRSPGSQRSGGPDDDGGAGVGARRRPPGPRPSLRNQNDPPPK